MKENYKFIRQGRKRSCKVYIYVIVKNELLYIEDVGISYDLFEFYNELVNVFEWDVLNLVCILSDFFIKFLNFQYFLLEFGLLE